MRTCRCSSIDAIEHCGSLDTFARVRHECAALKEILIPDRIWPEYRDCCSANPDEARHVPIVYLAFKPRHLAQLTEAIHFFCLKDGTPHPSLTRQYKNDLVERWMFKQAIRQRFRHASIFRGRLAELLFAAWLHHEGWQIEALEALGGSADVLAKDPTGQSFSFEVKHLGRDGVLFDLDVKGLGSGGMSFGWISVYSPVDYLLFRIFEAARQLSKSDHAKIIVMILDEYDAYFAIPLSERWIDWQDPKFMPFRESDIENFLNRQYESNSNLYYDMKHYIAQIDQIWFCDISDGLMMRRRRIDEVRG